MNNNDPIRNIARCENRPLGGLKHNELSQNEARDPQRNVTDPMLLMREVECQYGDNEKKVRTHG